MYTCIIDTYIILYPIPTGYLLNFDDETHIYYLKTIIVSKYFSFTILF